MTDRKQRNITPGKGDISTFLDCPDRWWESELTLVDGGPRYSCQSWYIDMDVVYLCENCRRDGECPRGFP